jgi:hypothetical protein
LTVSHNPVDTQGTHRFRHRLARIVFEPILTAFTIKEDKPNLYDGISGAWLLAVVATQSVASLSALVSLHWEQPSFFRFSPGDLSPLIMNTEHAPFLHSLPFPGTPESVTL